MSYFGRVTETFALVKRSVYRGWNILLIIIPSKHGKVKISSFPVGRISELTLIHYKIQIPFIFFKNYATFLPLSCIYQIIGLFSFRLFWYLFHKSGHRVKNRHRRVLFKAFLSIMLTFGYLWRWHGSCSTFFKEKKRTL